MNQVRYVLWESRDSRTKVVTRFKVAPDRDTCVHDLVVAEFPVSARHLEEEQKQRARDYVKYMNLLLDAQQQAYEQNQLVNILKA